MIESNGRCVNCGRPIDIGNMHVVMSYGGALSFTCTPADKSTVDHPQHYGGADNPYEAIKVIEAWELGFCLGNTVKYIARAGKKHDDVLEDLRKAQWYLTREIERLDLARRNAELTRLAAQS